MMLRNVFKIDLIPVFDQLATFHIIMEVLRTDLYREKSHLANTTTISSYVVFTPSQLATYDGGKPFEAAR